MRKIVAGLASGLLLTSVSIALAQEADRGAPGGEKGAPSAMDKGGDAPSAAEKGGPSGKTGKSDSPAAMDQGEPTKKRDSAVDKSSPNKAPTAAEEKGEPSKKGDTADKDGKPPASEGKSDGAGGTEPSKDSAKSRGDKAGGAAQLSGEQRTKVISSFRSHKQKSVSRSEINVEISVGVAVPRGVSLYAVPEDIVVIVPAYRRYKYFVFEDTVVIVDPDTYEVVDVIVLA